jgi:CheY-like chemotaxis protein
MAPSNETTVGLLLSDDMMFTSRITGTGRDLGFPIKPAPTPAALLALAQQRPSPCVILDLANPGLDVADLVGRLKGIGTRFVVAYGSHVDSARLHQAREAGCDVVWPRSKFVEELRQALPQWFAACGLARNTAKPQAASNPPPIA